MKLNSKIFLTGILGATFMASANANPIVDAYIGGMFGAGGSTIYNGNHKNTGAESFGAVVGLDIPLLRIEAEYNHLTSDYVSANDAMLNAYFKMLSTMIHPYIGVGVGSVFGGHMTQTDVRYDVKSTVAYQGMVGLTFDILALPIKFDVEGRALYAQNFAEIKTTTGVDKPDLLQYDARLKLRYIF